MGTTAKSPNTISLCMIGKDEEKYIGNCLDSVLSIIDELVFVDTGSTDKTEEIVRQKARDYGVDLKFYREEWQDDFSYHRNRSFDMATCKWILWLDCDDTVKNPEKLREYIEEEGENIDVLHLPYDYIRDQEGNVTLTHWRERVLRNLRNPDGSCYLRWCGPVHEYLVNVFSLRHSKISDCRILHNKVPELQDSEQPYFKSAGRNLKILEKIIKKAGGLDKVDIRTLEYYAKELLAGGREDDALNVFLEYIKKGPNDPELLQALCTISSIMYKKGDTEEAYNYALMALRVDASWPDPYILLAHYELLKNRPLQAFTIIKAAFGTDPPDTNVALSPLTYNYTPYFLRYKALMMMGRFEEALKDIEVCLEIKQNEDTKKDYETAKEKISEKEIVESVKKFSDYCGIDIFMNLPEGVRQNKEIQNIMANKTLENMVSGLQSQEANKKKVAFFCGSCDRDWGPYTPLNSGLGGSETAVVYLAQHLKDAGFFVVVYGLPGPFTGVHDGIYYLPYTKCRLEDLNGFDLVVSVRRPELADWGISARRKVLWLQDVSLGDFLTKDRIEKFDNFMMVSHWQAEQYRILYGDAITEKAIITSNAINTDLIYECFKEMLENKKDKDPYRFVYSSSPERGLEHLLDMWLYIKEVMPEASLHIYYGTSILDIRANLDLNFLLEKNRIFHKINLLKDYGVHFHGAVGQKDLYRDMWQSSWWVYPTRYLETNCITAQEAVACGLIPIVNPVGALPEILGDYGFYIKGSPEYPEVRKKYVDKIKEIVDDMKSNRDFYIKRAANAAVYVTKDWKEVADQWVELLF